MEGFSNWDREEPFDPFTVMLFKGLQVVAFMFFLAYLAINTDATPGKVDTKAEMLVTVSWPDNHPDDVSGLGSQRHPDPDLLPPMGNDVREHAIDANRREKQRDRAEDERQDHRGAAARERLHRPAIHGLQVKHR